MNSCRVSLILLIAILVTLPALAGWGGSGGGHRHEARRRVTVEICDSGESGTECRSVRYEIRPPNDPLPEICWTTHGEAAMVPCPKTTSVPLWLKHLNQAFTN
jgi:hypothetical protein